MNAPREQKVHGIAVAASMGKAAGTMRPQSMPHPFPSISLNYYNAQRGTSLGEPRNIHIIKGEGQFGGDRDASLNRDASLGI